MLACQDRSTRRWRGRCSASAAARFDLIAIVNDYVFGHVLRAGEQQARAASTDPEHAGAVAVYIRDQLSTGQFPHLTELARDPAAQAIADPARLDDRFERGLQALLDGALASTSPGDGHVPRRTTLIPPRPAR